MVARILVAVGSIGSHRELMRLGRAIEFCETTLLIKSTCYGAMNPFARLRPRFFGEYHPLNPVAADKLWCAYRDLFIVRGVRRDDYESIKDILDGDPFISSICKSCLLKFPKKKHPCLFPPPHFSDFTTFAPPAHSHLLGYYSRSK